MQKFLTIAMILAVHIAVVISISTKNHKCEDGSECSPATTCCHYTNGWGCCPYENGICCKDGIFCCPHGNSCMTGKNMGCGGRKVDGIFESFLGAEFTLNEFTPISN